MRKEEVLKVLHNESSTEGVPISFWRHFADNEFTDAAKHPEIITTNLDGHQDYLNAVDVDLVKTMLDGYFPYPFHEVSDPRDLSQLAQVKPLNEDDPWITGQVELAKKQRAIARS